MIATIIYGVLIVLFGALCFRYKSALLCVVVCVIAWACCLVVGYTYEYDDPAFEDRILEDGIVTEDELYMIVEHNFKVDRYNNEYFRFSIKDTKKVNYDKYYYLYIKGLY